MKKYIVLLILLIPAISFSNHIITKNDSANHIKQPHGTKSNQTEMMTLAGNHGHSGGYGAIFFKGTSFKNQTLLISGVKGAWVVNRSFGIGIEVNGIIPTAKYLGIDPEGLNQAFLVGGYGGMLLEPILWSNKIIHLTFPVTIGAGWLGYIEDWENQHYYYNGKLYDDDIFWHIEPGINLEVNIARFFRAGVGITKRFAQDLDLINTSETAFDNLNYVIILKFGGF